MNFLWLKYFAEIADCGGLAKAAKKIRVSAPSLSHILQKLENEVGSPLFERRRGRLYLNDKGEEFLAFAKETLLKRDNLCSSFKDSANVEGEIRLSTTGARIVSIFPLIWPSFKALFPKVTFKILDGAASYQERLGWLRNGIVNLLITTPVENCDDLRQKFLCNEYDYLVLQQGSALFQRICPNGIAPRKVSASVLDGQPFLLPPDDLGIHERLQNIFHEENVKPVPVFECRSLYSRETLVAVGMGATVTNYPETIESAFYKRTDYPNPGLRYIRLDHPLASRRLALIWRKSMYLSKACRSFVNYATITITELLG